MKITLEMAVDMLKNADNILVLSHHYPDGDTLGSASALCRALLSMGKNCMFRCDHAVAEKFAYLFSGIEHVIYKEDSDFIPSFITCVDVADISLLGSLRNEYEGKVDLSIDHHVSSRLFAENTYVDSSASAVCEILCDFIGMLGVTIDKTIANSLYVGISTDTGCFRYRNVTSKTMRCVASLMETGIDAAGINYKMFEVKSKARIKLEMAIIEGMQYGHNGKIAMVAIEKKMVNEAGAGEGDLDGISAITRTIDGVLLGITLREKEDGDYKVSLRALEPINACDICAKFGGGGHPGAAGCTLSAPLSDAKKAIMEVCTQYLRENGL